MYKGVYTISKSISLKVNVKMWWELELIYYDVAVQYVSHYTMRTPCFIFIKLSLIVTQCQKYEAPSKNWTH